MPATIFTGDVTVEFGAGAQIVTEGSVELSTHDAVPTVTKTVCLARAPVVSTDCTVSVAYLCGIVADVHDVAFVNYQ